MAKSAVAIKDFTEDSELAQEHQVLYRKFRPRQFNDVVGQDHIIAPLKRMVAEKKVGHAFLFVGPRGCGKTTTARLLAMASNCANLSTDGEPCGQCSTCSGIITGTGAIGLHELDAASNRGIGEMKDLIAAMGHGSMARKKVFVIDECHMLTKEASNALLKTLEEPPADTLIILATTEANKVLDTIQSRAVRYNFKTVDPDTMTGLVRDVVEATGMDIDSAGIAEVVRRGHGSPRDTLTALEGYGGAEANDDVRSFIPAIADALVARDSAALIIAIAEAVNGGVDIPDLTSSLLGHWRNCLLALEAPAALQGVEGKALDALAKQAKALKPNRVVRLLNVTSEAMGKMNLTGDARLLLETTLLQVALPSASDSLDGIYDRLDDIQDALEELIEKGVKTVGSASDDDWPRIDATPKAKTKPEPVVEPAEKVAPTPAPEPEPEEEPEEKPAVNSEPEPQEEEEVVADPEEELPAVDDDEDSDDDPSADYSQFEEEGHDDDPQADDNVDGDDSDGDEKDSDDSGEDVDAEVIQGDFKHSHEEWDESGFLECPHPHCVAKYKELDSSDTEKGGNLRLVKEDDKATTKKKKKSKFYDVDDAPTALDLVEVIQHEMISKRYSRYLSHEYMEAHLDEGDVLVLTMNKGLKKFPPSAAIDEILACQKDLWIEDIEYVGKES